MVNSWTGRFVRGFVKSRNAVFKIAFINYLTPIFHYIVSEYFPFLNFGSRAVELNLLTECRVRDNRLGLLVHGQLLCVRYIAVQCYLVFSFFIFTI